MSVLINTVGWSFSLAVFYFAWPYIRHRGDLVVVAAVLCFSPFAAYPGIYPPLLSIIPVFVVLLGIPTPWQMKILLLSGVPIGFMAAHLWHRFVE